MQITQWNVKSELINQFNKTGMVFYKQKMCKFIIKGGQVETGIYRHMQFFQTQ